MKIKNLFFAAFIIALFGVTGMLQGCYKDSIQPTVKPWVWPAPPVPIDTNDTLPHNDTLTVFYGADIQTVFNANCTGCHGGSTDPNLTTGNSYAALFAMNNMIDTTAPASSILYTKIHSGSMTGYSPAGFDATVLTWITEGAHNN